MANITLLGASYTNVPAVTLPQTGGGTVTFYENVSMWKDKKICVFGDSIGYGYNNNAHSFVDILSERNVFADVHKNCVSGSTTSTLYARLLESATEMAAADIIYAEYEANDINGLKAGTLTTATSVPVPRCGGWRLESDGWA